MNSLDEYHQNVADADEFFAAARAKYPERRADLIFNAAMFALVLRDFFEVWE